MQITDTRFEPHSHTYYSSLRLIDAINPPEQLIDRAVELGLSGIAITDHDCLSAHIRANKYAMQIKENHPDFKVALGNEIYLCGDRSKNQPYYHFILIAKNLQGHIALRELSSKAWLNSYVDRRMERVVTTYDDLKKICKKYPNTLIATTACLAGCLSYNTKKLIEAERLEDHVEVARAHDEIVNFILMCKDLFGEDFYIECAPGCSKDQIMVNRRLLSISSCFNVPMVIGSDSHYLTPEQRPIHKAFLNSKEGEREVDVFYQYAYLQSNEEIIEHLAQSDYDRLYVQKMFQNSNDIYNKVEEYSILSHPEIPTVDIKDYPKKESILPKEKFPVLSSLFSSTNEVERYWVNQCFEGLKNKNINWEKDSDKIIYLERLEEEARTKKIVGEKIHTNMFSYPVTLQHYIDMIWDCGSTVGAGRGSACAGLNHWLLGITQLDPVKWNLPWFRYMNSERLEIADVDIDVASDRRPTILKRIKAERKAYLDDDLDDIFKENLGCTLVATFRTESAKSAILVACRGYRSEEWPEGIDIDIGQYLSSLIPTERGEAWSLEDVLYGNEEKGRKPVMPFVREVEQYPGLIDIALGVQQTVSGRGEHASGVIFFEGNPFEKCAFMRAPNGDIITQWDLHQAEAAGNIKYDVLITKIQDKILQTIKLLQEDGQIEKDLSLREIYNKYLHPEVLPTNRKEIWQAIKEGCVLDLFQ